MSFFFSFLKEWKKIRAGEKQGEQRGLLKSLQFRTSFNAVISVFGHHTRRTNGATFFFFQSQNQEQAQKEIKNRGGSGAGWIRLNSIYMICIVKKWCTETQKKGGIIHLPCHYTFLACCEADSLSLKQTPKSRLRSLLAGDFWTSGSKNKKFEPAKGGRFDGVPAVS